MGFTRSKWLSALSFVDVSSAILFFFDEIGLKQGTWGSRTLFKRSINLLEKWYESGSSCYTGTERSNGHDGSGQLVLFPSDD